MFEYKEIQMPEDCELKISPSSISKFFELPVIWYKEEILKEDKTFKGNNSTVLGTICHKVYESVQLGDDITQDDINTRLLKHSTNNLDLCLDTSDIILNYPLITKAVVNEYLLPRISGNNIEVEKPVIAKVLPNVYVGGTLDRLEGTVVVDFKTVGKAPSSNAGIPFNYKIQLLTYAWALQQNGYVVDTIRLVYGVKPTKTLPARCFVVEEPITYKSQKLVQDTLNLIGESYKAIKANPELVYLIFKSMDLK